VKNFLIAFRLFLILTVLTGLVYPLVVTVIAHLCFPRQANGSMVTVDGKMRGSELVGQKFVNERYFWSRPSAIDYNPMPSGASNLGPTSEALQEAVQRRRAWIDGTGALAPNAQVSVDLLFSSGSGVDPHISPETAHLQIDRVAKTRGFTPEQKTKLADLVERCIEPPQWGIFGEPRVNVFLLNSALDRLY
jgi:potassium-transporting ATPase KdpC subunit